MVDKGDRLALLPPSGMITTHTPSSSADYYVTQAHATSREGLTKYNGLESTQAVGIARVVLIDKAKPVCNQTSIVLLLVIFC